MPVSKQSKLTSGNGTEVVSSSNTLKHELNNYELKSEASHT